MKIRTYSRIALALSIISTVSLSQRDLALAESQSAEKRVSLYLVEINNYINKTKEIISSLRNEGNDGAREVAAEMILLVNNVDNPTADESANYKSFLNAIRLCESELDKNVGSRNRATGSLVFEPPKMLEILRYQLMGLSDFPLITDTHGAWARDAEGKAAAIKYAGILKMRNEGIISALDKYLEAMQGYFEKLFFSSDKLKEYHLQNGLKWAYQVYRSLPQYMIEKYNNKYSYECGMYKAWEAYAADCFNAYQGLSCDAELDTLVTGKYVWDKPVRTDWFSVVSKYSRFANLLKSKGVEIQTLNTGEEYADSTLGPVVNFPDIGSIRKTARDILSRRLMPDGYDAGVWKRNLQLAENAYVGLASFKNARFNLIETATRKLINRLNQILAAYKDYFPYYTPFEMRDLIKHDAWSAGYPYVYVELAKYFNEAIYNTSITPAVKITNPPNGSLISTKGTVALNTVLKDFDDTSENIQCVWYILEAPFDSGYLPYQQIPGCGRSYLNIDRETTGGHWKLLLVINNKHAEVRSAVAFNTFGT